MSFRSTTIVYTVYSSLEGKKKQEVNSTAGVELTGAKLGCCCRRNNGSIVTTRHTTELNKKSIKLQTANVVCRSETLL